VSNLRLPNDYLYIVFLVIFFKVGKGPKDDLI